jgi:hypothetical protein
MVIFNSYVSLPEGTPKSHGEKAHVPHGSLAIDPPDDGRALSCCASSAEKTWRAESHQVANPSLGQWSLQSLVFEEPVFVASPV